MALQESRGDFSIRKCSRLAPTGDGSGAQSRGPIGRPEQEVHSSSPEALAGDCCPIPRFNCFLSAPFSGRPIQSKEATRGLSATAVAPVSQHLSPPSSAQKASFHLGEVAAHFKQQIHDQQRGTGAGEKERKDEEEACDTVNRFDQDSARREGHHERQQQHQEQGLQSQRYDTNQNAVGAAISAPCGQIRCTASTVKGLEHLPTDGPHAMKQEMTGQRRFNSTKAPASRDPQDREAQLAMLRPTAPATITAATATMPPAARKRHADPISRQLRCTFSLECSK